MDLHKIKTDIEKSSGVSLENYQFEVNKNGNVEFFRPENKNRTLWEIKKEGFEPIHYDTTIIDAGKHIKHFSKQGLL